MLSAQLEELGLLIDPRIQQETKERSGLNKEQQKIFRKRHHSQTASKGSLIL
jgi:hypothetical protein